MSELVGEKVDLQSAAASKSVHSIWNNATRAWTSSEGSVGVCFVALSNGSPVSTPVDAPVDPPAPVHARATVADSTSESASDSAANETVLVVKGSSRVAEELLASRYIL